MRQTPTLPGVFAVLGRMGAALAPAAAAPTLPWQLSGCLSWWESDDSIAGSGGTAGLAVSCTDKAASYVATNADGSPFYPTRNTVILPGHAVFGANAGAGPGQLYSADATLLAAVNAATTWTAVGYCRNGPEATVVASQMYAGASQRTSSDFRGMRLRDTSATAGQLDAVNYAVGSTSVATASAGDGAWHRWVVEWNRTTGASTYRVDNGAPVAGPTRVAIGAGATGVGLVLGSLGKATYSAVHALYDRALTAAERTLIDAYLVSRFV